MSPPFVSGVPEEHEVTHERFGVMFEEKAKKERAKAKKQACKRSGKFDRFYSSAQGCNEFREKKSPNMAPNICSRFFSG